VGEWTLDKLKILEQYLPGYLSATRRARERIYIDAFAGPGRNELKDSGKQVDGSPLIAIKARGLDGTTRFDKLYFFEKDPLTVTELKKELQAHDPAHRAEVISGDVNLELPEKIRTLPKLSPTFVLLDTEGIEPQWVTLKAVAPWKTELLINFPFFMAINRNLDSHKIFDYLGEAPPNPPTSANLLRLYKRKLSDLGYTHQVEDDRLVKTKDNIPLYYLIFVSKVDVGKRIMKWVFNQPDAAGQTRMLI